MIDARALEMPLESEAKKALVVPPAAATALSCAVSLGSVLKPMT